MVVYGNLPTWVAIPVNASLIATLALFPALFAIVVRRLVMAFGPRAVMAAPLVWVATELGRTYVFGGFPWVLLGYSQASVLPIAQFASIFGVYGISGLVASVSSGLAVVVLADGPAKAGHPVRSGRHSQKYGPVAVAVMLVVIVAVWGSHRASVAEWTKAGDPVRVGLLQGNVDQGEKWNASRASSIFADYVKMTDQAIAQGAELVIWPESSTPFRLESDDQADRLAAGQLRGIAAEKHVAMLIGSEQIEPGAPGTPGKYYNAAFLIQADGSTGGVYRKMHLVPFGEYVPMQSLFFFAGHLVEAVSDFSPGTSIVLLPLGGHLVSTAICYEVVYPDFVRQFVRNGSELLTTITNDAWFGDSSAPYPALRAGRSMRAIEGNGRYLVLSANTGISGIVDPYGHVLTQSGLFQPAVIVGTARLLKTVTFYTRYGDVFAYAAVVATLVLLLQSRTWRLSMN